MHYYIRKITDFIAFRTTKRYNVIKIRSLKPSYYDKDTILLHAVMQLVVDYVEIELASEADSKFNKVMSMLPYIIRPEYRSRKAGTARLNYLIHLKDNDEDWKTFYKEIEKVYIWWTDVYPQRLSVDDMMENFNNTDNIEDITRVFEIENNYYKEEETMLKTVIKYRQYMWT